MSSSRKISFGTIKIKDGKKYVRDFTSPYHNRVGWVLFKDSNIGRLQKFKKSRSRSRIISKKSRSISRSRKTSKGRCVSQKTKKYISRKSPPYPANECRGKIRIGNDNQKYISKKISGGVYRWFKKC